MKTIKIKVLNSEVNALESIVTIDYEGNIEKYEEDRMKALNLWGKIIKQFDNK